VAGNAVRHGIFANTPVVPGESPADWEAHRAGVVAALAPAGLPEVNLAERAALLLWRLARLANFEAATTAADVEDAGLLPPGTDPFAWCLYRSNTDPETYLKLTQQDLQRAREDLAAIAPEAALLRRVRADDGIDPLPPEQVRGVLAVAYELAAERPIRRFDPDTPGRPEFLARIGSAGADVRWTRELLLAGLAYYAGAGEGSAAEFRSEVQAALDARAAALARAVDRLEAEAAAIVRRAEAGRARAAAVALLPPDHVAERVMRYEKHLHELLTSTLHELERLQARRDGAAVVPPVVADVQVTVAAGAG
jgi:hypothetical protein